MSEDSPTKMTPEIVNPDNKEVQERIEKATPADDSDASRAKDPAKTPGKGAVREQGVSSPTEPPPPVEPPTNITPPTPEGSKDNNQDNPPLPEWMTKLGIYERGKTPPPTPPSSSSLSSLEESKDPIRVTIARRLEGIENDNKEVQRRRVREIIEEIESSRVAITTNRDNEAKAIELRNVVDSGKIHPAVANEVRARLNLHECAILIRGVGGGKREDVVAKFRANITQLDASEYILTGEDFHTLLKATETDGDNTNNGIVGIPVRKAYEVLESAAVHGLPIGQKGNLVSYYDSKTSDAMQSKMNKLILDRLGGDTPNNRKALDLAKRYADATFKTSEWRTNAPPYDPISQIIYFQEQRQSNMADTGPQFTYGSMGDNLPHKVGGFGTSFTRQAKITHPDGSGKMLQSAQEWERIEEEHKKWETEWERKQKRPSLPGSRIFLNLTETFGFSRRGSQEALQRNIKARSLNRIGPIYEGKINGRSAAEESRRIGKLIRRGEDGKPVVNELTNIDELDFRSLETGAYAKFIAGYIPSIMRVNELMLKSDWTPDDFSVDQIAGWIYPFKHADPTGALLLKEWFLGGAISEGLRQGPRKGWGQVQLAEVVRNLTTSIEARGSKQDQLARTAFMTRLQVENVLRRINAYAKSMGADFSAGLQGVKRVRK